MEQCAVEILHSLNASLLQPAGGREVESKVALASFAFSCLRLDLLKTSTVEEADRHLVSRLQTCAVEVVAAIGKQLYSDSEASFHGDSEDIEERMFWDCCLHVANELSDDFGCFVSRLRAFSERCDHVIRLYTTVADQAMISGSHDLQTHIVNCVSQQLDDCRKPPSHAHQTTIEQWTHTVRMLAISHVMCHAHKLPPSSDDDLVSLSAIFPGQLHSLYKTWLEGDKARVCDVGRVWSRLDSGGGVMKSVHLLVNSLWVLATVARESGCVKLKSSVAECALRLVNNCWEEVTMLAKQVPRSLPLKMWYIVLGSAVWLHREVEGMALDTLDNSQQVVCTDLLFSLADYCNGLRDQIISYHSNLISSCLLHDASSHDWTNTKPFFEGERISFSIQMWHYHLYGLQHDLWTLLPADCFEVSVKIFSSVFSSSLSHLARRYSSVTPSYSRVNQFKADILTILCTASHLLPSLTPPSTTLTHHSSAHLLCVLSLGGSPLEDLEGCLAGDGAGMKNGMVTGTVNPLRNSKQHTSWMNHLEQCFSSIFGNDPPNSSGAGPSHSAECAPLMLSPHPNWSSLLQVLLFRQASLAVELCGCEGGESIIPDMAVILSRCHHCEWALYSVYTDSSVAPSNDNNHSIEDSWMFWLKDELTMTLSCHVLSGATCLHGNRHQQAPSLNHLEKALSTSLDGLQSKLALQLLPPAVVSFLKSLAETLSTSANPPRGPSGSSHGQRGALFAKMLGEMVAPWLDATLAENLSAPLKTMLTSYLTAYKHLLLGTSPHNEEAKSIPHLNQLLCQPKLKECISKLGSTGQSVESHDQPEVSHDQEPSMTEHEIVADLMSHDPRCLKALHRVYTALRKKWTGKELNDEKFNPFKAWCNKSRVQEPQDNNVDWKSLLDSFTLLHLDREMLTQLVYQLRWELQEGAGSILEEREGQLVANIQSHLCYHSNDDCSV